MEYERGTKMETQALSLDRISTLPENIIENILSLIPIRDALRTSILSKKWQYSWRSMPKLVFTDDMVEVKPSVCNCFDVERYKIINAIFHVLLFHNGPTVLEFNCSVGESHLDSEFAQIFSYLSKGNNVKKLIFISDYFSYKLPISFFSMQGLEFIQLDYSTFEPPLTFKGFSRLKSIRFWNVTVSAQMLQRFLSKCPLLEQIYLCEDAVEDDFAAGGKKLSFVDFFQYVPLIQSLDISKSYMKLSGDGMPYKLPTSLVHLKHLYLELCFKKQNEISSALCVIRSAPVLVKIKYWMYHNEKWPVPQTPTNFLDPEDNSDLKLDHLETLEIDMLDYLPLAIDLIKLIMAKSPVLKKVKLWLKRVSVDEKLRMLTDLVQLPLTHASPSAEIIIKR